MMVQKLIKNLINFLGPREEIGSPSQEHSFYYLESVMMVQKLINKFLGPKGRNWILYIGITFKIKPFF
jgi:hypothetical protein